MAASGWYVYNSFKEKMADGTLDMDDSSAGVFKCALFTSSFSPAITDDLYSALSNEVANGNGYTTGGEALTSVTWVESSGTVTWDADNITWTASGGSIVSQYAVIYDVASSQLICYCQLDSSEVTLTDTNTLTIQINASGIFTISGGGV